MIPSLPPQPLNPPFLPIPPRDRLPLQEAALSKPQAIHPIWLKPIVINMPGDKPPVFPPAYTLLPKPPVPPRAALKKPSAQPQIPLSPVLQKETPPKNEDETSSFLAKKPPAQPSALDSIAKSMEQLTQLETKRSKSMEQLTQAETERSKATLAYLQKPFQSFQRILMAAGLGILVAMIPTWMLIRFFKQSAKDHEAKHEKQQQQMTDMSDMSKTLFQDKNLDVKLDDVQGIEGAKAEIIDIIRHLKAPGEHNYTRAKMPKGVLLEGPPGNGKTMLAKAIAAEAGVPFFSVSGSEFVEKFVGVGASRVRSLFEEARKKSPCVIFIDEIDSVGRQRSGVATGGGAPEEHNGTLLQLLKELDGMASNEGILVLAATNRADVLDKALVRPGRFDKTLSVKAPWTENQRLAILKSHIAKHYRDVIGPDVDLAYIAEITEGGTGAELANLANEASRLANRRILNALVAGQTLSADVQKITQVDFIDAFENVLGGVTEPKDLYPARFTQSIVVHEGLGHAWLGYLMEHPIYMISTQPRSGSYGHVHHGRRRGADKLLKDRQYYLEGLLSLMAGTAAEEVLFSKKQVSNGATSDLAKANGMLRTMMSELGFFNQELGFLVNLQNPNTGKEVYTENEKQKMEALTRKILDNAYARVRWVIEQIPTDDKQRFMKALTDQRVVKGPQANLALFESNIQATQNAEFMKQLRAVLDEFIEDPTKEFRPPR